MSRLSQCRLKAIHVGGDILHQLARDLVHLFFSCGSERCITDIIDDSRNTLRTSIQHRRDAIIDYLFIVCAGNSNGVLQIALNFCCRERVNLLPHTGPLAQSSEFRKIQPLVDFRRSHQNNIGATDVAGVCCGDCFKLQQRLITYSKRVLNDNDNTCIVRSAFTEQALENRELLHRARCLGIDAETCQ